MRAWRGRIQLLVAAVTAVALTVPITFGGGSAPAAAAAPDGSGTITVTPTYTINSSTGNFFTFTYTAATGGMTAGELTLVIPAGWSAPDTNGFNPGAINALCGDSPVTIVGSGPWTVHITNVTLPQGSTCDIHYGINGFGTVVAPSSTGTYTFTTQQKSTAGGTLTSLASQPTVLVDTDGTGTMTVNPASALVGTPGNTHTFHYTAARAMTTGELTVQVPATWSAPSTTGSAPGFTTSTCGTVAVVATTIHVTGVTLANAASCDIVYGATSSGGPGATAPSSGGTQTFTVQQQSDIAHNNLQAIGTSPAISVVSPDGSGTMTVTPTSVITSSSGNFFTFTYTAANPGGLHNGELTLVIPAGWSAPDTNGFNPGAVNALCGDSPVTITGSGPWTVHVLNVTLPQGSTCDVHYGISGFGTVVAPAAPGNYTFTTQERSVATGTLTSLAASPQILVGDDGTGTMTVAPASALVSSTGNTFVFTYTAARTITAGALTIAVPVGWSAPSTTGTAPGFSSTTCPGGSVGVVGSTIQVTGINLANAAMCTITYGSTGSGGPGAVAPATGGTNTFTTQQKSASAGTLTNLATGSPQVFVVAPDGTGTMTVTPTQAINNSTGNFFTFTYTAANPGGLHNGELTLVIPAGWSAPDTNGFNPGAINALCGDSPLTITGSGPWTVHVLNVTLPQGATCDIHYGINGFGTVTAPNSTGAYTFTTQERSVSTGTLTSLSSSPVINVGTDGTGTMTVAPTTALVSSTGNTLVFTYTAATTMTAGQINVAVPAGWSSPSTTGTAPGFTATTCPGGTVAAAGSTIQVSGVNLATAANCTITYGSTGSGGPGATAPSSGGTSTFTTQQKSTAAGTLTTIGSSPQVFVVSADGSGTMTVTGSPVVPGSSGNALTFTYTAANGSLHNGEITLQVPAGWTAPDPNGFNPGGTNALCGDSPVTISGSGPWTIHVLNVNLVGGATCDIHYGISGFGTVTAPAAAGTATFIAQERSLAAGVLTSLASSPQVVIGTDGGGTLTVAPTTTSASSTGNTLDFTFTAPVGGLSAGQVNIAIPAGWSAPSTTGTNAGFTTTSCAGATVGISVSTIQVTGINLAAGATCDVMYGAKTSGGPGATAPASPGVSTFTTQEKSTAGGTLTDLSTGSPQVTVFGSDGSGTLTVAPTTVGNGSNGNTLVFTYTAATGGTTSGQLNVAVPAGWTAPSTTGSNAGFTQSTCGSVAIAVNTIQVSGIGLSAGGTCTITYGSTTSGGAGATAPASAGIATFFAQEKSTGGGTLTNLASSPQVTIPGPPVTLSTASVSIPEGNTSSNTDAGINVLLGAVQASDVTVHVSITGGTATAGTDTSALDQDLQITAGQTMVHVPLTVTGDDAVEPDETAIVTLSVVSGAQLGSPSVATVTITNDDAAPTVSIEQSGSQADPTSTAPIVFTVTFSEPVTGFGTGDVTLGGTAGATTATVSGSGTSYTVDVTGMSASGTVIATIGAGAAVDSGSNPNAPSTSVDNTVEWVQPVVDTTTTTTPGTVPPPGPGGIAINTPGGQVSLEVVSGGTLLTFTSGPLSAPPPDGFIFPFGQLSFTASTAPGGTIVLKMVLPMNPIAYFKLAGLSWLDYVFNGSTGAQIIGNTVVITITDNGRGDTDPTAGIIADPAAPAIPAPALPATGIDSETYVELALMMLGTGVLVLVGRRQRRRATVA